MRSIYALGRVVGFRVTGTCDRPPSAPLPTKPCTRADPLRPAMPDAPALLGDMEQLPGGAGREDMVRTLVASIGPVRVTQ